MRTILLGFSSLMLLIAFMMLFPLAYALLHQDSLALNAFLLPVLAIFLICLPVFLWALATKQSYQVTQIRQAVLIVALSWLFVTFFSAIPFSLSGEIPHLIDAFFESVSGYTTTGASILQDIESVSDSLLLWRSMTHWFGGMGFIVLTVALFPLFGISGLQMMKAEAPGPSLDRLTYRITHTAKILWIIYSVLTLIQIFLLKFAGMNWLDSLIHSFGTMATGGFSNRNQSVAAYASPSIEWIITIFMMLAGTNFIIYFYFIQKKFEKLNNIELKVYYGIFFFASLIITLVLYFQTPNNWEESIRKASFQVASILTTTGFASDDYSLWPSGTKGILLLLMFIGGCAGSTAGGVKVIRIICLVKKAVLEMRFMLQPRGVFRIFLNRQSLDSLAIAGIIGFFILYVLLLLLTTIVLSLFGNDLLTSFSAALATLGNIGPGFAEVGPDMNYSGLHPFIKLYLSLIMLIGRLELYTVLIILMPRFWRR